MLFNTSHNIIIAMNQLDRQINMIIDKRFI